MASISPRMTKSGEKRYIVRYRLGGRTYPVVHGGSFRTRREAMARRDFIAGEIAAGRNPKIALKAMLNPPATVKIETLEELGRRYLTSRIDLDEKTERAHKSVLEKLNTWGGDRDPHTLTFMDCQEFVGVLTESLQAASVRKYFNVVKLVLDFAGAEPNPARDKRVKLPAIVKEEVQPPSDKEFLAILDRLPSKWVLMFVTMEQTAMAIGEAVSLTWGDVDVERRKFRLRYANVKGGISSRARMIQVPDWVMEAIEATCPLEDRVPERKVFQGVNEDKARRAMRNACTLAGIPHFSPHDLRHRRLTRWHHDHVPVKVLAERAGHSSVMQTLETYSHTLDPGEVAVEELQARVVKT
jgi:integrase